MLAAASLWMAASACRPAIVGRSVRLLTTPTSAALATPDPTESMVYAARTSAGVIVIDLGWWGAEATVRRALAAIGARPADVSDVFLTHSHRDHVGAWPLLRHARVHLALPEEPRLFGRAGHRARLARWADAALPPFLPRASELRAVPFGRDTVFALGGDTLRAFLVPGHTAGSAAFLFRGVLFAGDAITHTGRRFGVAKRGYTDDPDLARRSMASLWARVDGLRVTLVCSAHARCAPVTEELRQSTLR